MKAKAIVVCDDKGFQIVLRRSDAATEYLATIKDHTGALAYAAGVNKGLSLCGSHDESLDV